MQDEKNVKKRLLQLLSHEELKLTQKALGRSEPPENTTRGFTIFRTQEEIKIQDLFKNEETMRLLFAKIDELIVFFEGLLNQLEKVDLIKIYEETTSQKLDKDNITKSEIIKRLLDDVPIREILKNKRFQNRLKPKYVSISEIKSLHDEIGLVRDETIRVSNNVGFLFENEKTLQKVLNEINAKLKPVDEVFRTTGAPSPEDFLKAMYEEAIALGEKPSPESFHGLVEHLREKLGMDERTFVLKGVELLLTHYFISEVRGLLWRPTVEGFMGILKQEMIKLNPSGDRVDIPSLRNVVSRRLGINEDLFDDLLISAWKEDHIRLEAGAPIGEFNVKYLVTKEGQKFYYVRSR